jgi:hypothetical protein
MSRSVTFRPEAASDVFKARQNAKRLDSSEFNVDAAQGAAQSLQIAADPDLEHLLTAWPGLSSERRRCILAIIGH